MSVGGRGEGAEMRISTSLMAMGVLLIAACAVISGGCAAGSGDPGDTAASPPGDLQETSGGPDTRSEDVAVVDAADGATELVAPDSDPVVPYRVVALGDLHGDLVAAKAAFKLAGVIDDGDHWIGGGDIVVQTGDVLDRWHLEREVMDWMEARRVEAVAAGGDVIMLVGNHENNNLEAYYADVDAGACAAFADLPDDTSMVSPAVSAECKKRAASLLPGGTYARLIATKRVAAIVGDSVFVHGGLLPQFVSSPASIDDMNTRWAAFARGESGDDVDQDIYECLWDRSYSDDDFEPDCESLSMVLESLGVSRMVVGHSIWPDINAACHGQVWRIDTAMSTYYGGDIEVLEITDTGVGPITE
jgi:hypothetical protein